MQGAIFVNNQGEVHLLLQEGRQLIFQIGGVGDEPRLTRHGGDIDLVGITARPRHGGQQIAGVQDAGDVFGVFPIKRNTRVAVAQGLFDDLRRRQIGVYHVDLLAVDHDLANVEVCQVEHAAEHIAVVTHDRAFFVVVFDGAANLFVRR